jgi:hypothetical protein
MTPPPPRLLSCQRDTTNVSRKPIFSNHHIHFNETFGVGLADNDAGCRQRQSWYTDTNELQGLGLEDRIDCQRNDRRHLFNISGRRQRGARSARRSDSRRAMPMQRKGEQERACNHANNQEETSFAGPMASTRPMLQPVKGGETSSFELGRSRSRRVLLPELAPRRPYFSIVMAQVSAQIISG